MTGFSWSGSRREFVLAGAGVGVAGAAGGAVALWRNGGSAAPRAGSPHGTPSASHAGPPANGAQHVGSPATSPAGTPAPPAAVTAAPIRPPATPLAVRSMYLSGWSAADEPAGTWPTFWNGHIAAIAGIVRVDGAAYTFLGSPTLPAGATAPAATRTAFTLTPTRSVYTLAAGGVSLTVTFLSPVDLGDLRRQSVPMSYVSVQAAAADGRPHRVTLYLDISGEWAHGDVSQPITWSQQLTGGLRVLTNTPQNPDVLAEFGDQASWGTVVWATDAAAGLTWQIGRDQDVRGSAATQGALAGTADTGQPRAISDNWPVFGFNRDLGTVTPQAPSDEFVLCLGHVRTPAVSYLGSPLNPWWSTYWSSWPDMLAWFRADYPAALAGAQALDDRVASAATAAAGPHYAALCALALRQAVGATELVDHDGAPWALLKEISSDGNVSTVDVIYPSHPAFLYLSPDYLRLLLEPVLDYCESGRWPNPYCVHDLGSSYPNATGHDDGGGENMPVEESANMLIMAAAVVRGLAAADGAAWARAHYRILKQWADYLVTNALDPGIQNQTDDFTGPIAHSVNLALKGIVGIGAMSVIATAAGSPADATSYLGSARAYIARWRTMAEDPSGPHLDLAYGSADTWSLKYNGYADRLLGLGLIPDAVAAQEAAWYQAQAGAYGVALDPRHDYTKADWELWTAAWLADRHPVRDLLVDGVYRFADTTSDRVPFTDWYAVPTAARTGFQARPVVGGVFALLNRPNE